MTRRARFAPGRASSQCNDLRSRWGPAAAIGRSRCTLPSIVLGLSLAPVSNAWAGMPYFTLTELAQVRLQDISFFLLVILLVACCVLGLWRVLRKDFPRLPSLGFRRALAMVTLLGLAFYLVLVMIAGARELMTPGAWKKQGATYHLAGAPPELPGSDRRGRLEALRRGLWAYAAAHEGRFPANELVAELPETAWQAAGGVPYIYVAGQRADQGVRPVVYEPGTVGQERLALRANGAIEVMTLEQIQGALKQGSP
jgi:hypothetical protein